ncbi:hypothetical protein ACLOJK_020527 [Asimina triloba]
MGRILSIASPETTTMIDRGRNKHRQSKTNEKKAKPIASLETATIGIITSGKGNVSANENGKGKEKGKGKNKGIQSRGNVNDKKSNKEASKDKVKINDKWKAINSGFTD